jgi:predicted nucleic acid-binding protein
VCFDASAALSFALQDEPLHAQAKALIEKLVDQGSTLCAPPLFLYECDSIIRLRVFKGALSESEAQEARAIVRALAVAVEHDPANGERAYQIARDYHQPRVYNAWYAAYAEARGVELVTVDKPFFEAVNGCSRPKNAPALTFVKLLT